MLPILHRSAQPVTDVYFSPHIPDTCILMFADVPPLVYDLRTAGVMTAFTASGRGQRPTDPLELTQQALLPNGINVPVAHVAYRSHAEILPSADVAMVLGHEDQTVHRVNLRTGKNVGVAPCFENGQCLAYSHDGRFLAAGSTDGQVSVFDLEPEDTEPDSEPVEILCERQRGGIRALAFRPDERLQVATDLNSVKSIEFGRPEWDRDELQRHVLTPEGESGVQGLKINAMATSPTHGLIAMAGTGKEVWTIATGIAEGERFALRGFTRINRLQFVESRNELLVFGDAGLAVVPFEMINGCPHYQASSTRYNHYSERVQLAGFHQYRDLLCLLYVASPR